MDVNLCTHRFYRVPLVLKKETGKVQLGFLTGLQECAINDHILVPPSIVDTRSSTDLVVREKEKVRLLWSSHLDMSLSAKMI